MPKIQRLKPCGMSRSYFKIERGVCEEEKKKAEQVKSQNTALSKG